MGAWQRLTSGSHVFSEEGYPFHVVRYNLWLGGPLWETMWSTSYSSLESIRSGGGREKEGPCASV